MAKRKYNIFNSKRAKRRRRLPKCKLSWPSCVRVWMRMSSQALTEPFFVEPKSKIDVKYYQNKVLKHLIREKNVGEWKSPELQINSPSARKDNGIAVKPEAGLISCETFAYFDIALKWMWWQP
ncbi:hypothetical protein TNCV_3665231 [Trichonephila clavipes]|nr:hypothetical protein TNCV_3665231 [Trichonephila clavipes]